MRGRCPHPVIEVWHPYPGVFTPGRDQGATLPERRQCSCALKRQAGQVISEITRGKFKHHAERQEYDETFALVPSLLQGRTSIDTM